MEVYIVNRETSWFPCPLDFKHIVSQADILSGRRLKNSFLRKIDWPKEKTLEIKTPWGRVVAGEMVGSPALRCDGD